MGGGKSETRKDRFPFEQGESQRGLRHNERVMHAIAASPGVLLDEDSRRASAGSERDIRHAGTENECGYRGTEQHRFNECKLFLQLTDDHP